MSGRFTDFHREKKGLISSLKSYESKLFGEIICKKEIFFSKIEMKRISYVVKSVEFQFYLVSTPLFINDNKTQVGFCYNVCVSEC